MYLLFYFEGLVIVGHVILPRLWRYMSNLVTFSNSSYISNESIYSFRLMNCGRCCCITIENYKDSY